MARKPNILVVGSSNSDLVLSCSRLPKPGETLLGGAFHRFHGGKGANQAVAAARAGAHVTLVAARGDDEFGRSAAANLKREKINLRHFVVRKKICSGLSVTRPGAQAGMPYRRELNF